MSLIEVYRRQLPHWRTFNVIYLVTWRSLIELEPADRSIVAECLAHFHAQRYWLEAFVVMNDHVHVLVEPRDGFALEKIIHTWKSFTAKAIGRRRGNGGSVWQSEYWDTIMRGPAHTNEALLYILNNPRKRWPNLSEPYRWVGSNRPVEGTLSAP